MERGLDLWAAGMFASSGVATTFAFATPIPNGIYLGVAVFVFGVGILRSIAVYAK